MRVILYVKSGPGAGQRFSLRSGHIVRVGRTDWSDFSFPEDTQMADTHFSLEIGGQSCRLRSLASSQETFVNQRPVTACELRQGDEIRAGRSTFQVVYGDLMPTTDPLIIAGSGIATAAVAPPPRDLVAECESLEISGESLKIAAVAKDADDLLDRLTASREYASAVRWLAHQLPKREAVWWGSQSVRSFAPPQKPNDLAALNAAENWVREPSETHRRQAEMTATAAKFEGAAAMLAAAAFWSGGSIAPEALPEVLGDPRLTGKAVSLALLTCTLGGTSEQAELRWQQFLQDAKRIHLPQS